MGSAKKGSSLEKSVSYISRLDPGFSILEFGLLLFDTLMSAEVCFRFSEPILRVSFLPIQEAQSHKSLSSMCQDLQGLRGIYE